MSVYSISDFRQGLDVRRTPLTAPGGSLRILDNAVLNQGGEIEKRLAFVSVAHAPAPYGYLFGQGTSLHVFKVGTASVTIDQGTSPVPVVGHNLADPGETITEIIDVEAFQDKFQVSGIGASGTSYVWFDGALVIENDTTHAKGTYSRLWKAKMYRVDGHYLRFSGVNNPAMTNPSDTTYPGAGFINIALSDPDGEDLQGMEVYYSYIALLARLQTQIWTLDPDPAKDTQTQLLRIGTLAPHSIVQFGTGDVLFLSDSGVRSLRAMTINLAASVSDVGSAIDLALIPSIRANETGASKARGVVQPIQGRYWLHMNGQIYVLSYFPSGQITAWSTFSHGFNLMQFAVVQDRMFALGDDGTIYAYGGPTRDQYDSSKVTVRTPHHSADAPTENKRIKSIDVMCQGAWSISMGMLPNNTEAFEPVANISNNTFGLQSIPFAGYGTHFGVHMEHQAPGPALMAQLHFNIQEGWVK